MDDVVKVFEQVPLHVAVAAWEKGTPEEKEKLAPAMQAKLLDKTPEELKLNPVHYEKLLDDALLHGEWDDEDVPDEEEVVQLESKTQLCFKLKQVWHGGGTTRFSLLLNRAVREGQLKDTEAAALRKSVKGS